MSFYLPCIGCVFFLPSFFLRGFQFICKSGLRLKVGHKSPWNWFLMVFPISLSLFFFQSLLSHSLSALNLVSFSLKRSRIIKYSLETCFPEKVHQMQPLKADKTFNFSHWPKSFTIKWNFKKNLQEFFGRMSSPRLEWRFHQGVRLSFYLIRF